MTKGENYAALNLFHAIAVEEGKVKNGKSLAEMLKYGILPIGKKGLVEFVEAEDASLIIGTLGLSAIDWSQSFHKSWNKVADAPIEQLIAEQVLNYFSNYGMEALGLSAMNYVPAEEILVDLDAEPAIKSFSIVKFWTQDELVENLNDYLKNVKAPHKNMINHVKILLPYATLDIEDIKSFELKILYCDMTDKVPADAQNFLRLAIYKSSCGCVTTVIKDEKIICILKTGSTTSAIENMFKKADLEKLSESFYRFKPLFLAFKANKNLAPYINKIRRLAVKNHKPVSGFTVANVMNFLANNRFSDAMKIIEKADNRELIKLINFALYENVAEDHVYNIRNGKVFVKVQLDDVVSEMRIDNINWIKVTCMNQLKKNLNNCFAGKVFYIPSEIKYAAPASEKQMLDIFPYGTRITPTNTKDALCIAGHWMNQGGERVDLDFHMCSAFGSVGWNSSYRTDDRGVLYSGDMTSAPEPYGAVEAFRIASDITTPYELSVHRYCGPDEVDFKLLFTNEDTWSSNYRNRAEEVAAVINPKNVIAPAINLKVRDNMTIGFYHDGNFIINGGSLGGSHRVPNSEMMVKLLNASLKRYNNMLTIDSLIALGGGQVISDTDKVQNYYDLSAGNLTSTTLFDIVDGKSDKLYEVTGKVDN